MLLVEAGARTWLMITGRTGILVSCIVLRRVRLTVARLNGASVWLSMALVRVLTRLWWWEVIRTVYLSLDIVDGSRFLLRGPRWPERLRLRTTVCLLMVLVMVARLFPGLLGMQMCCLNGSECAQSDPVRSDPLELMTLVRMMPGVATTLCWQSIYGLQMNDLLEQRLRLMKTFLDLRLFLVRNGHRLVNAVSALRRPGRWNWFGACNVVGFGLLVVGRQAAVCCLVRLVLYRVPVLVPCVPWVAALTWAVVRWWLPWVWCCLFLGLMSMVARRWFLLRVAIV